MFKQRLISALILIPLVLMTLFYAPASAWVAILATCIILCGWEWLQLIPVQNMGLKIIFIVGLSLAVILSSYLIHYWLPLGLLLWMAIILAELGFPTSQKYWGYPVVITGLALILLPLAFQSLLAIYYFSQGKALFLYALLIVWAADTGAYCAGKMWGKHKLIPNVSPGKSWEGVFGGLLLVFIVAYSGYLFFKPQNLSSWLLIALAMGLISIVGDLFISMLKRRVNLKDTGTLIPGHGGFLDRLDSLIAVAPIFYFGLRFL